MTTEGSDALVARRAAATARNTSAGVEIPLSPGAGLSVFATAYCRPSFHEWRKDRHENLMGYAFHSRDDEQSRAGFPQVISSRPASGQFENED